MPDWLSQESETHVGALMMARTFEQGKASADAEHLQLAAWLL